MEAGGLAPENLIQPTISLEMPVPIQRHCGFPSFPVVDWFCLFVDLWVLPFPLEACSVFGNFVITLISTFNILKNIVKQILILYPLVTDISGRLYHDCIAQKIILQNHCMIDRGRLHIVLTHTITVNEWCSTSVFFLCVYLLIMPQRSCLSENCSTRYNTLNWIYNNSRYLGIKLYDHPTYYTNHDHLTYK